MKTKIAILLMCVSLFAFVRGEEAFSGWNPDVKRLLSRKDRDEALQKLLKERRYLEKPLYTEASFDKIKDVVICKQPPGKPLVTVFAETRYGRVDVPKRSGHFMSIRSDGVIIPFYNTNNVLDGIFDDINVDGIVDYIDTLDYIYDDGFITCLSLVPITEQMKPALVIYWKEGEFNWRIDKSDPFGITAVQIFPIKPVRLEVVAEYKWSKKENRWMGPSGSLKEGFLRVDGDPDESVIKQLLNLKAEQAAPSNR